MTNETLHEQAVEWVKTFKRAEGELIALLQVIDERRSYLEHGVSSLFRYCTECLGLTEAESFRYTQVTRKATEVPALQEALSRGEITVSKASRIAPVLKQENATEWIEKARAMTYRDLEKEVIAANPEAAGHHKGVRCGEMKWTEVHHAVPVSDGGRNTRDNLVTLCSGHHRYLHRATCLAAGESAGR